MKRWTQPLDVTVVNQNWEAYSDEGDKLDDVTRCGSRLKAVATAVVKF